MKEIAAIISAVASLLWPILAFAVLAIYRKEIGNLIARLRKGKLLGQEIELDKSLDKLERSATDVAEQVASLPASDSANPDRDQSGEDDVVSSILREAARSPRAALLLLASELEREARQLLASVGHLKGRSFVPPSQAFEIIQKQFGGLSGHISSSLKLFWEVRNRLVHGARADDEEILRAIDSGITILKALQAFPRETNYVYHPGVAVFKDADCTTPWPNTKAVILDTHSAGGTRRSFRIFPTTKTHFTKGRRVAWEWDSSTVWKDAWYKDPDSGETKLAWNSSMEFVGRHLEDV